MIKDKESKISKAKALRKKGFSHREIATNLNISLGTAFIFTKGIKLSPEQHRALIEKSGFFLSSREDHIRWSSKGSNNWLSRIKHTDQSLLREIKDFYNQNGRIPTKREFFSHWHAYYRVFGSWNKAILAAGYDPNPELFAKKHIAKDGHVCDSLSEKIIDDCLFAKNVPHQRNVYYPNQHKFKTDFLVKDKYWVEFLGLKGVVKGYDKLYQQKKKVATKNNIKIIEVLPIDLFPNNKLHKKYKFLFNRPKYRPPLEARGGMGG